jgi:hypothetical protein
VSRASSRRRREENAKRLEQAVQRRMAGLEGLVHKAVNGDPNPLVEYLGSGESRQLSGRELGSVAWYIARISKRNGRPPGSLKPKNFAIECAAYLVRIGTAVWRRERGYKRAPTKGPNKSPKDVLAKCAIELVEQDMPQMRGMISAAKVKERALVKPRREVMEYVGEFLDEARQELIDLALE